MQSIFTCTGSIRILKASNSARARNRTRILDQPNFDLLDLPSTGHETPIGTFFPQQKARASIASTG